MLQFCNFDPSSSIFTILPKNVATMKSKNFIAESIGMDYYRSMKKTFRR